MTKTKERQRKVTSRSKHKLHTKNSKKAPLNKCKLPLNMWMQTKLPVNMWMQTKLPVNMWMQTSKF
jgi:hypothetical protein